MNVLSRFLWVRNPNPWLRWMLLACFLSKPVVKTCCLGLQQGSVEEDPLPSSPKSLLAGSHWPETWVPCPMAPLSIWAPHDMVCFPRLRAPRRRESKEDNQDKLCLFGSHLLLDGTSCHSCCTLWLGVSHEVWSTLMGRGFHKGMTPVEGIIGKQEVGWGKDAHILQGSLSQAS